MSIQFKEHIKLHEVPLFRGAIIASLPDANILFHNHSRGDSLRFAHPLIQYKQIQQRAGIFAIGEGAYAIGEYLAKREKMDDLIIGKRPISPEIDRIVSHYFRIQLWENPMSYRIRNWLPLNSENYKIYNSLPSLTEQIEMLERLLVGNILSLLKGVGIFLEERVICKISKLSTPRLYRAKGIKFMAYDVDFQTNVSLPQYSGLGKHASIGYGIVTKRHEKIAMIDNKYDENENQ